MEEHRDNSYDSLCEFVDSFHYEYDAIPKDPRDRDANMQAMWVEQNKRNIFLGKFVSRNLKKDYEDAVIPANCNTMTFSMMVTEFKNCYTPTRNYSLANYEFHMLRQKSNESSDSFVKKAKHEAKNCQFSCEHENCTVPNILICDQTIIGTSYDEISKMH